MKQILVIDDTKNIRILLEACLNAAGYAVETAADGEQALQLLQTKSFDLLFLDIKLPGLSGTEVLRRLDRLGIKLPVVVMTAFATVKNAVECTKLGAVAYLQKPFTAEKVRQLLDQLDLPSPSANDPDDVVLEKLIAQAEYAQATGMLKKVLLGNPLSSWAFQGFGRLCAAQGNPTEAAKYYFIADQLKKFEEPS